jgi:cytoskeletal protein CcmA (bactofilin family)
MFRRKDEGADDIDGVDNDSINTGANTSAPASAAPAPSAPAAPVAAAPLAPSAPNVPSQPAFRPVAPQAAMAAASRATAAPAPVGAPSPLAAAPAPVASAPLSVAPDRMPAAPVTRPAAKRVLTVGPDIQMKGEVTSCDRVIIEGSVDATMRDVHTVELAETGSLKGTAEVEDAEISGMFEGDLIVRGRLTVHSSGRVRGNVTYGEIEIQRGGQISGNIRNAADAKAQGQSQKKAA